MIQRFTLLHDGSDQGWQAAYLAFHISARLGASLLVLLVDSAIDSKMIALRAAQVEIGGRAAGLAIRSRLVADFSVEIVAEYAAGSDGLFVPRQLVQEGKSAEGYLAAVPCPLWIAAGDSEIGSMALLATDAAADKGLIDYTAALSNRLQEPLVGLVQEEALAATRSRYPSFPWQPLPDFSPATIAVVLNQRGHNILFLPVSAISLLFDLPVNCVVCPA